MTEPTADDRATSGVQGWLAALREFAFGMTGYEFARQAIETRAALENLFLIVVIGDMVGLPVMPPYYSLRLLPFVTPEIATWKRRVLRERELSDQHEFHLHGV
jgi:hypothetical protein